MEQTGMGKYTRSFGVSFAITSIVSGLLVIVKELNEDTLLGWMKAATGHHWVTHGVFNLIVFVGLGWVFSRLSNGQGVQISPNALVICIVVGVVLGGLINVGFYM
jgi:lipoprotein signal peptidase